MPLMSRGNNVQRLDLVASICALYKNPVLLYGSAGQQTGTHVV